MRDGYIPSLQYPMILPAQLRNMAWVLYLYNSVVIKTSTVYFSSHGKPFGTMTHPSPFFLAPISTIKEKETPRQMEKFMVFPLLIYMEDAGKNDGGAQQVG